jgi:hypothetical protein
MKTIKIILICILAGLLNISQAKTVNLDPVLKDFFETKQFSNCYKLAKVINSGRYSSYTLSPFGVKYKEDNVYISSQAQEFEFKSLYLSNRASFYTSYINRTSEILKYFKKDEIHPQFLIWADSIFNSPIPDQFGLLVDNYIERKYKRGDDIPEIRDEMRKTMKLNEIYNFLKSTDTVALHKIFDIDNSELISLVKNRKVADLMTLDSKGFNIRTHIVYSNSKEDPIQNELYILFEKFNKSKRLVNKDQIIRFLYRNTKFTKQEKAFVTFYFVKSFLRYCNKDNSKFTEYSDIDNIVLYKTTVCNGYALLYQFLLKSADVECYHISLKEIAHANNIVVINNKAYYVDVTWGIYCKEIGTFKKSTIKSTFDLEINPYDYKEINDFSYIKYVNNIDDAVGFVSYLNNTCKK